MPKIVDTDRAQRLKREAGAAARKARREALVLGPLFAGVLVLHHHRNDITPGLGPYIQVFTVIALVIIGWVLAGDLGRLLGPVLLGRLDPATAGTVALRVQRLDMVRVLKARE